MVNNATHNTKMTSTRMIIDGIEREIDFTKGSPLRVRYEQSMEAYLNAPPITLSTGSAEEIFQLDHMVQRLSHLAGVENGLENAEYWYAQGKKRSAWGWINSSLDHAEQADVDISQRVLDLQGKYGDKIPSRLRQALQTVGFYTTCHCPPTDPVA